jgi:hypothetical protein
MKKETISRCVSLLVMMILFPISLLRADGGYVSRISRSVTMSADQRAILIKKGNEISMTFSTGYTGEGEDFGWIIPVPAPPAAEDISETGKNGERALEMLDKLTAPIRTTIRRRGCFPSGTEVLTAIGPRAIETVESGTEVYGCDLSTGDWVLAKVIERQSFQWEGDMVAIRMGQNAIQAAGKHPFFVLRGSRLASRPPPWDIPIEEQRTNGGDRWVEARDLRVGDVLKDKGSEGLIITGLSSRHEKTEVYNLEVEGYSN